MTVDREQIRRDAARLIAVNEDVETEDFGYDEVRFARGCLALLAELEQAEKERDDARKQWQRWERRAKVALDLVAEARLAAVPALVEALERIKANAEAWHGPPQDRGQDRALSVISEWASDALAAFESDREPAR